MFCYGNIYLEHRMWKREYYSDDKKWWWMTVSERIYCDIRVYRGRGREKGEELVTKRKSKKEHLLHKGFHICKPTEPLLVIGVGWWVDLRSSENSLKVQIWFFASKYPFFWRKCLVGWLSSGSLERKNVWWVGCHCHFKYWTFKNISNELCYLLMGNVKIDC